MNGIELSRKFYEEYVEELISNSFPEYENRIAVGISGRGSDCYGFDDDISKDHDFNSGVSLWLTEEDYKFIGRELQREYDKLPKEITSRKNPGVKDKFGVHTIDEFFVDTIGTTKIPETSKEWLEIPEYALFESVNGEMFRDDRGEMLLKRAKLLLPSVDVRRKKIASYLALAGQAGQYNYYRMHKRRDEGGMFLSSYEFVKNVIHIVFWINNRYCPYYKWMMRALAELPKLSHLETDLVKILKGTEDNRKLIEEVSGEIISELRREKITSSNSVYLEEHAFAVNKDIKDEYLKKLHIMAAAD